MASLVIQTSFLGDMVLTTPLLAELARRGPVDVVATPANAGVLANHPAVREVVRYDKRGADRGVGGFVRLARRLRGRDYDAAYLAQGSTRSAALALAAGVPRRVGFSTSAGRRLYTERVTYRDDLHHAARLWLLSAGGEAAVPTLRPRLYPGAAECAAVDALVAALPDAGTTARPMVALAPGSVWATKRWPFYAELAGRLAATTRIAIIGGGDDAALAAEIVAAVGVVPGSVAVLDAVGRLSLLGSAELLRRAAVVVSNDSAPLHLASAVDAPTVAIFGPTVTTFGFGPLATRSVALGHEALPCRPCDRHGPRRCPLEHWRCMRDLDAALVARHVHSLLATSGP